MRCFHRVGDPAPRGAGYGSKPMAPRRPGLHASLCPHTGGVDACIAHAGDRSASSYRGTTARTSSPYGSPVAFGTPHRKTRLLGLHGLLYRVEAPTGFAVHVHGVIRSMGGSIVKYPSLRPAWLEGGAPVVFRRGASLFYERVLAYGATKAPRYECSGSS
jgi:hypothetical protein